MNEGISTAVAPNGKKENTILKKFYARDRAKLAPSKYNEFLDILLMCGGIIKVACGEYGISRYALTKAVKENPELREAIYELKEIVRLQRLDDLENISFNNALDPKMITERIFQLKAHSPEMYRDKQPTHATQVNVVVSGTPIKDRGKIIARLEAEEKARKKKRGKSGI